MRIKQKIIAEIIAHARQEVPLEACGYLAAKEGVVEAAYALVNQEQSPEHFSFDPEEQFRVLRAARAKGLQIVAVYHSHPASPPRPSVEDIKLAFDAQMIYLIVSLVGREPEVKAFRIKEQQVASEPLEVIEDV
jgi:proteasome lid subunit RPN8/RPN11